MLGEGGLSGFGNPGGSDPAKPTDSPLSVPGDEPDMTVAADTRAAVRAHPFVHTALRAGVLNYTAAAEFLGVGDTDAVAAALRRYAEELDPYEPIDRRVSVSMRSGVARTEAGEGILSVGGDAFAAEGGDLTAIVGAGDVGPADLESVLGRLRTAEVDAVAAAGTEGHVAVVVERRAGPDAVRLVEDALEHRQATH